MTAYWDGYGHYEPTKPIEVKGGIKAQSKRGSFAQSWWAKRWVKTLESFNMGARLSRGKSYARKGQVTSIKIDAGLVRAKVQGSNPTPYSVTIKVRTLNGSEWELLAEKLVLKPIFAAKLLAGEMPEDIDSAFKEIGLSIFPETLDDLETDCSCPDWSNPCKHIAAVYYLLGEEFDRDPFLIFKLRGVDMDEFMSILGKSSGPENLIVSEARIFWKVLIMR
ncbi:MAG: SWIM zinc finger family protein [Methanosarcina barkeri]|nr:SWIM zinc finger family protein [Methanosarcina sp. ERenArc_MAG2]